MRDLRSDTVLDGEEALSFVEDQEPDVMVLDLKMPGIDGMEVLRQVRKAYPKIQVIILTGHGTEKHEEEAKRLGAFDYLEKPVNLDVLVKKMKAAYRRKLEDTMVAATFAEAGDFESAKKIMDEDD
jgi:DNA-binding response OmpR family regulator